MDKAMQYRECLKRMDEKLGKELVTVREAADYCGVDTRTIKKNFTVRDGYLCLTVLAHEMVYGVNKRVLR